MAGRAERLASAGDPGFALRATCRKHFHARFSARGKLYRYRIWNDRVLPPFEFERAWHVPAPLDFDVMAREAAAFAGRHDFASFAANRGRPEDDTGARSISCGCVGAGASFWLEVSGDGFLYKMVRLMVGALVRAGRGQAAAGEIRDRLRTPERASARGPLCALRRTVFISSARGTEPALSQE